MSQQELLAILHHFDGRPTGHALESIWAEGIELDDELVRRLVDFEILKQA